MSGSRTGSWVWRHLPGVLTALRLALAPLLYLAIRGGALTAALALVLLAAATDLLDGYLARRLRADSPAGGYFDATSDFVVIVAAAAAFVVEGVYPLWLLPLLALMFLQFLLTGRGRQPVYDPVGKFLGAVLFVVIALTAALPDEALVQVLVLGTATLCLLSLASRGWFLAAPRPQ